MSADETIYAFRRNVVVAASAGTGKTHRLTALFALLALGLTSMEESDARVAAAPVAPERIVATTFSRAAAAEIRGRVERALVDLAGEAPLSTLALGDAVLGRVDVLGDTIDRAELRQRAAAALARFGGARIDTLHGIAADIVRRHALALGVAPNARILDEEESRTLGDLAVDEALGDALSGGGERTDAARAILAAAPGVGFARHQLQRLLDRLDEEGFSPRELAVVDHAATARAKAAELASVAREVAAFGHDAFQSAAARLARGLGDALPEEPFPRDAHAALLELFALRKPSKRAAADDLLADFIAGLSGSGSKADRASSLVATIRAGPGLAARERAVLSVLEDASRRFSAAKRRAGGLGFGDLLRLARNALRDDPAILDEERDKIDALLVDEFQDTSRVQRDLVYLLRERRGADRPAGSSPRARDLRPAGLFLVGDRKQSIYGFRGADVAVFRRIVVELCGHVAAEQLALADVGVDGAPVAAFVALRESRRSGARILDFVNAFATRDFSADAARPFEIAYGPGERLLPCGERDPGEVIVIRDDGSSPEGAAPIVREASGAAREAHVAAAFVAARVAEGLAAFRDVAILARRRSTIPFVEVALSRLDIPYVVAGRALYDTPEVRDVAALLRLLLDPRDRLALATVLRGPIVALSDGALALLSPPGKGLHVPLAARWSRAEVAAPAPLEAAERARLEAFRSRFASLRRAVLRLSPGDAIHAATRGFDLDRVLAALPRAEARIGNLDRLVSIARRRGGTLSGFVRWLEQRIRDDADEAEAAVFSAEDDAVRVTTMHASKGLDFPIVVLLDLNAEPRPEHAGVTSTGHGDGPPALVVKHWAPRPGRPLEEGTPIGVVTATLRAAQVEARARELAERKRITYVAMTRARDALVLVSPASTPRTGSAWSTFDEGATSDQALRDAVTNEIAARSLLAAASDAARDAHPRDAVSMKARAPTSGERPLRSPARTLAIAVTPLALFAGCPRRFQLRSLVGLEEPVESGQLDLFAEDSGTTETLEDLRAEGSEDDTALALGRAAHRVLEHWPRTRWGARQDVGALAARLAAEGATLGAAETARTAAKLAHFLAGAYARSLAGAELHREVPFVVHVSADGRSLALRGAIDLLVVRGDGGVDVLDYKLSRPRADLTPYAFQLHAYALAARRAFPSRPIRAGVVFLGAREEPSWLSTGDGGALDDAAHGRFEAELADLVPRLADARWSQHWTGVEIDRCRALHCGFVTACHPASAATSL